MEFVGGNIATTTTTPTVLQSHSLSHSLKYYMSSCVVLLKEGMPLILDVQHSKFDLILVSEWKSAGLIAVFLEVGGATAAGGSDGGGVFVCAFFEDFLLIVPREEDE